MVERRRDVQVFVGIHSADQLAWRQIEHGQLLRPDDRWPLDRHADTTVTGRSDMLPSSHAKPAEHLQGRQSH
jgi:hypothetical protein